MISLNDVLLAMSNIPVDDPIAEIWGRGLQGGYKIIKYTGSLPITINANGDALIDYRIYGADGGVGVATENLLDPNAKNVDNGYVGNSVIGVDGAITNNVGWAYVTEYIPVDSNTNYIIFANLFRATVDLARGLVFYDENKNFISAILGYAVFNKVTYESGRGRVQFTTPENCRYIRTSVDKSATMLMLVAASTPPPTYIPYGYKLSMMVGDGETTQTVPVYIGENQLGEDEYVSYGEQKIYRDVGGTLTPTDSPVPLPEIPTIDGETVIDYDGEPKPSQMYVKYKGKSGGA